jgi:hypothetical protein
LLRAHFDPSKRGVLGHGVVLLKSICKESQPSHKPVLPELENDRDLGVHLDRLA